MFFKTFLQRFGGEKQSADPYRVAFLSGISAKRPNEARNLEAMQTAAPKSPASSSGTCGCRRQEPHRWAGAGPTGRRIRLDRAYVRYAGDSWNVVGGKFANPFVGTDLVWDDDFNPLGIAGSTTLPVFGNLELRATGTCSIVNEQTLDDDSAMGGGQLTAHPPPGDDWQPTAAVGYYAHTIGSLANAGPGDIRDNFLTPDDSGYRSDFDLANATIELKYTGFGDRWPARKRPRLAAALRGERGVLNRPIPRCFYGRISI